MAAAVPNDVCDVPGGNIAVVYGNELDACVWVGGDVWNGGRKAS